MEKILPIELEVITEEYPVVLPLLEIDEKPTEEVNIVEENAYVEKYGGCPNRMFNSS